MASLSFFHFSEFFTTALYKPETATYDCKSVVTLALNLILVPLSRSLSPPPQPSSSIIPQLTPWLLLALGLNFGSNASSSLHQSKVD